MLFKEIIQACHSCSYREEEHAVHAERRVTRVEGQPENRRKNHMNIFFFFLINQRDSNTSIWPQLFWFEASI